MQQTILPITKDGNPNRPVARILRGGGWGGGGGGGAEKDRPCKFRRHKAFSGGMLPRNKSLKFEVLKTARNGLKLLILPSSRYFVSF